MTVPGPAAGARDAVRALVDLVLPTACAGCGAEGTGQMCPSCTEGLRGLVPGPTKPTPAPEALPPCTALGGYEGPLRGLVIAYKERGAYRLAKPLGTALGVVVESAAFATGREHGTPIVVVPVPATAAAIRERHGDHVIRLAGYAIRYLRAIGRPAVAAPALTARPKNDSSHLDATARAESAADAFRARPGRVRRIMAAQEAGAIVIVVDDILTTGATVAAVTRVLSAGGVRVDGAATIAATRRRDKSLDRARRRGMPQDVEISP
jgi:predicted amidophosphoribosyltransferase